MKPIPHPQANMAPYLLTFAAVLLLLSPLPVASLYFLKHSGEIANLSDVVAAQQQRDVLYGASLMENIFRYKLELIRQRQPVIVVVGSSRSMHIQEQAFTASFVNAGGSVHSLLETQAFVQQMLAIHHPKVLLLAVDYVWFNRAFPVARSYPEHGYQETEVTRAKLLRPLEWLADGKLSWSRYWGIVTGRNLYNPETNYENMGVFAIVRATGYVRDGSHVLCDLYANGFESDRHFDDTRSRMTAAGWGESKDNALEEERVAQLAEIVRECQAQGVRPVIYLTPLAPTIYRYLMSTPSNAAWLSQLDRRLRERFKGEYYNAMNGASFGTSDCEAIDGTHPGDAAHYRLLSWIDHQNPTSALSPYLDRARMAGMINTFQGHAFAYSKPELIRFKEIDFLDLGCKKTAISRQ